MSDINSVLESIERDFNASALGQGLVLTLTPPERGRKFVLATLFHRDDAEMEGDIATAALGSAQSVADDIEETILANIRSRTGFAARMG